MKRIIFSFLLLIPAIGLMAQVAVNNNGSQPDSSAMLDVQSSEKGVLIPRLSTLQQIQISNPETGLLIFNTDSLDFFFFNGAYWLGMHDTGDSLDPNQWICGLSVEYEGQSYSTVQIGTQCWMAENLNVGHLIDGSINQTENDTIEKYCYNNEEDSCSIYGGFYQWNEMMQYSTDSTVHGICPEGWHIPTDHEWKILEGTVDSLYGVGDTVWNSMDWRGYDVGKKLKSTSNWHFFDNYGNGTDDHGFTVLPAGMLHGYSKDFIGNETHAHFWSSTHGSLLYTYSWYRSFHYSHDNTFRNSTIWDFGLSIRCLKN